MAQPKTELENLICDEEFIRWVTNPTLDSEKYWKAWMEAHPEYTDDVLKAKELILSFHFHEKKASKSIKQEVLENIIRNVNRSEVKKPNKTRGRLLLITSLAASVILLAVFVLRKDLLHDKTDPSQQTIANNEKFIKTTPTGVKLQTILPDGSRVWLNSESKLTYDSKYNLSDRSVYLEGEAFFEVKENKEKPFVVHSGGLQITALGTSFNVNSINSDQSSVVALVTGKVEVVKKSGDIKESVVLEPGQKAIHHVHAPSFLTSEFSIDMEVGWKSGILSFESAGYQEVKKKLERWYGVKIQSDLSNTNNWNYTGKFEDQSLEIVLKRLAYIKKFRYKLEDKNVYLYN